MPDTLKSFVKENQAMLGFLIIQALAIVAYAVRLETRVSIMETRGSEYTVQTIDRMTQRVTVLEEKIDKNIDSINKIIEIMTKNLSVNPSPGGQR